MIEDGDMALIRRAAWRIVPFAILLFLATFLDRVNVGYAALTMNKDIGLSASAFGLGAGIFFIGYFLFETPSNLILEKIGPRVWIARIMVTWGLLSGATAFVTGPTSFYVVRFLLGAAEAGFFPGMILYFTYWFPGPVRARILGAFLLAVPLSSIVGAPVSTALLGTSLFGLKGWQSMFLVEAAPSILLGVAVFFFMTDRPAKAAWLSDEDKARYGRMMAPDAGAGHLTGLARGLTDPRVWLFAVIYFGIVLGLYGLGFWAPQIIKGFGGLSNMQVGLLSVIPYGLAAVAMVAWGLRSDLKNERVWHLCLPALVGAGGFAVAGFSHDPALSLAAVSVGAVGILSAASVFWTLPSAFFGGSAAAVAIAVINSIGNLGGYVGPYMIGLLRQSTGGYGAGFYALAGCLALAGLLALLSPRLAAPPRT